MSYEGYVQALCVNGHYSTYDCYDFCSSHRCFVCTAPLAWVNDVDQTNCEDEGYLDMAAFLIAPAEVQQCNLGHSHEVAPAIYSVEKAALQGGRRYQP